MAVKETISLEGAEQVKKAWQDVGQAGENALSQLRSAGLNFGNVMVKFGSDTDKATDSVSKHSNSIRGLREGLHVLSPILKTAGQQVGELGAFARVAQGGLIGLAAAITGTVLVALSKMGDSAALAKNSLEELLQSKDLGSKAFDTLDKGARDLGTSTSNLIPVFNAARTALQSLGGNRGFVGVLPPGVAGQVENLSQSVIDLFSVVRRSTGDSQKAQQALVAFFEAVKRDGVVTRDALDQLRKVSPGAVNVIAQAFSLGQVSADDFLKTVDQNRPKLDDLLRKLATFKSINPGAFNPAPVTAFGAALESLGRRVDDIIKAFTGSDLNQVGATLVAAFQNGLTIIANVILDLKNNVVQAFTQIVENARTVWNEVIAIFSVNPFEEIGRAFSSIFDSFVDKARDIWNRIKSIFSEPLSLSFLSGGAPIGGVGSDSGEGFATGGLFRGKPGRDTNLAWLSDLEFVMRPEAVRRYGVGFMHMINSLRFPSKGFALGGLVEGLGRPAIPAFASGGLNLAAAAAIQGGTPFTLVIGNETFGGLTADDHAAHRLIRFGRKHNRASGGRAPSSVR